MIRRITTATLVLLSYSSSGCSLIYDFEKTYPDAAGASAGGRREQGGSAGKTGTEGGNGGTGGTIESKMGTGGGAGRASATAILNGGVAGIGDSATMLGGFAGASHVSTLAGGAFGGAATGGTVSTQAGASGAAIVAGGTAGVGAGGAPLGGATSTGGAAAGAVAISGGTSSTGGVVTGGAATGGVVTGGSTAIPPTGRAFVPITNSCQGLTTTCRSESCCTAIAMQGGTFPMGASPDPAGSDFDPTGGLDVLEHQATVASFALDKYEVAVGRFRRFVSAYTSWHVTNGNPAYGVGQHPIAQHTGWGQSWQPTAFDLPESLEALTDRLKCDSTYQTWKDTKGTDLEEAYPINCVDWFMAFAFCYWDGGRLPTEAEWEYAASGGAENLPYPWGKESPTVNRANYEDSGKSPLVVVGGKPLGAGFFGHLDLAGSVREWNFDWYNAKWYGVDGTPSPCNNCANYTEAIQRVERGEAYVASGAMLRNTIRGVNYPTYYRTIGGIRCARNP